MQTCKDIKMTFLHKNTAQGLSKPNLTNKMIHYENL